MAVPAWLLRCLEKGIGGGVKGRFLLSGLLLPALVGCADLQYTSSYPPPPETTRHAFAYVFGGTGQFGNASVPLKRRLKRDGLL